MGHADSRRGEADGRWLVVVPFRLDGRGPVVELRLLSAADVRVAVPMEEAVDAMRRAFGQLSSGDAQVPLRTSVEGEGGVMLVMPGRLRADEAMGAKVVSVFEGNRERGLPAVSALLLLVDPATGIPRAVLEGEALTALRTGAASGLATDLLARGDASVLTVFGAGVQARTQVEGVRAVRPIRELRIVSRTRASAEAFAREVEGVEVRVLDDPAVAVRGAQVICTATTSSEPVFPGEAVDPGTHVNGVGSFTPSTREVDDNLVRRARVVVDSREAALAEAGDLLLPMERGVFSASDVHGELGEIVNGSLSGREDDRQVTFFKSVGSAAQDLAVGRRALERAGSQGIGTVVAL